MALLLTLSVLAGTAIAHWGPREGTTVAAVPTIPLARIDSPGLTGIQQAGSAQRGDSASCRDPDGRCTWEKTYGGILEDKLYGVTAMPDGGAVVVGNSRSLGGGDYDALVLRLDRAGEVLWQQELGGRGTDQVYGVVLDAAEGIVVAGHTRSHGRGVSDIWVVRLDPKGRVTWDRTFGGGKEGRARAIAATEDGGSLVVGFVAPNTSTDSDAFVMRLDHEGSLLWDKRFGGPGHDGFFDVAVLADGSIAAAGHTKRGGSTGFDFWVVRMDEDGTLLWEKQVSRGLWEAATAVVTSAESGLLVVGVTSADSFGLDDAWILQFDSQGQLLWQRVVGRDGQQKAWAAGRQPSGNLVVVIATTSGGKGSTDAQLLGLDDAGNILWEQVYGGELWDRPTSLAIGPGGEIILGGSTTSSGAGYEDFWVLRLDSNGRR
jgi:uncharacterized delta-60 repeat protein